MRANIIRIGNSQGIRIPKILLEQTRLGNPAGTNKPAGAKKPPAQKKVATKKK